MDYLVVGAVALFASGLTLVSGFGLGTILLPAFAFFFPLPAAVALTAVVHFANGLFKLALVGLKADRRLVVAFGIPALIAAPVGAALLGWMSGLAPVAGRVTPLGLAMGALMIFFAVFELAPAFQRMSINPRWLPWGGALSGFIGGVSGHQGALRSAFLLRFKESLTHERFIATNAAIGAMVDAGRLAVYAVAGSAIAWSAIEPHVAIAATATLCAFAGAWLGARLIPKMTMSFVQRLVSVLLILLGIGVGTGMLG